MPRTLPAALTTAMDSGAYDPYIRVVLGDADGSGSITVEPLAYTLKALEATIKIPYTGGDFFRIVRGATINGTPSTISTIWFQVVDRVFDGKFLTLRGEPLSAVDTKYQVIAANSTYQTVIETALIDDNRTIVPSYEGTAAWKAYKFYPAGKQIVLSPRKKLFTLLKQKYLLFAAEDGFDGTNDNMFFFVATQTRATDYSITDPIYNYNAHRETRQVIWRDEASTVHNIGTATDLIYNLGYLESTAADPVDAATPININIGSKSSKLPVHLKYRTGDQVDFAAIGVLNPAATRVNVIEVLDLESTPSWYMILEALVYFSETEGGPLPSTIEAAAPFTPLATGNFDGILTANDNNLQAAMETIDDHGTSHFLDSEGNPADIGTAAADGTSTYGARRDHIHKPADWAAYTPTWSSTGTAPSLGNGTIAGKWLRIGGIVFYKIRLVWGSTTTGGTGAWLFTLPATALDTAAYTEPGGATLNDASVGQYIGQTVKYSSTQIYIQTDTAPNGVGQGTDFTWVATDTLTISGWIEA